MNVTRTASLTPRFHCHFCNPDVFHSSCVCVLWAQLMSVSFLMSTLCFIVGVGICVSVEVGSALLSTFLMCHSFNECVCSVGSWCLSLVSLLSTFLMCHSFNECVCSVGSWCHSFISLLSTFLMCHSFNACVVRMFLVSVSYHYFQHFLMCHSLCVCVWGGGGVSVCAFCHKSQIL